MVVSTSFGARVSIACLIIAVWYQSLAFASDPTYTLRQLQERVLERSPEILAARLRVQAAAANIAAARLRYWPQFSASYRYLPDRVDLSDDNLNDSHSLILRLSQDIVAATKVRASQIGVAKADLEEAELSAKARENATLLEFRKRYLDYNEARALAERHAGLSRQYRELYRLSNRLKKAGEWLAPDILAVEKNFAAHKNLAKDYEAQATALQNEIAAAAQLHPSEIQWQKLSAPGFEVTKEQVVQLAAVHEYEARAQLARSQGETSRIGRSFADVQFAPYVGYRYRWQDFGSINGSPELGIRLSFPILFPALRNREEANYSARAAAWEQAAISLVDLAKRRAADVFDQIQRLNFRLAEIDKKIKIDLEEVKIETAKYSRLPEMSDASKLVIIQLEAGVAENELEKQTLQFRRIRKEYELLHICGLRWPDEIDSAGLLWLDGMEKRQFATWVWKAGEMLQDEHHQEWLIRFCKERGLNHVYLSINSEIASLSTGPASLQACLRRFHLANIMVSALIGDPHWVYPENRSSLEARMNFIMAYNEISGAAEKFDAIHFDIEPQALDDWEKDKKGHLGLFVETIEQACALRDSAAVELPFEIDLPLNYHTVSNDDLLRLIRLTDVTTVMAYGRKDPENMARELTEVIGHVVASKKSVVVGFNAKEFKDQRELQQLMNRLSRKLQQVEGWQGFAIHDYRDFLWLKGE